MIKDPSLRAIVILMIPIIILYGLYVQFHGDYSPGGGFQAGVIIASAIILYAILFGPNVAFNAIPPIVIRVIGVLGILIYGGVGVATMLLGEEFLSYSVLMYDPVKGQKLGIFLIELGVGLTVFASMLRIYFNFALMGKK